MEAHVPIFKTEKEPPIKQVKHISYYSWGSYSLRKVFVELDFNVFRMILYFSYLDANQPL